MKKKQYRMLVFKKELTTKERNGVSYVIWNLNEEQKEFAESRWYVEPFLYSIRTKHFQNIRGLSNSLLKELHYANKKGKNTIVRKLSEDDIRQLELFHIKYRPIKYKIHLAG